VSEVIDNWLRSAAPAVVFDFNGTLSDDEPILFDIFAGLFAAHLGWQMTATDYRTELLGRSDREIVEYAVSRHGRRTDDEVAGLLGLRQRIYQDRVAADNPIRSQTVALVELIARQGLPLAIVTGAHRDDVSAVLRHSPVGALIPVVVAVEDVTRGKPDPEGFLTAARRLDRRAADILVFEDSVPGVRAALAAGMHCVAVSADPEPELTACAPAIVPRLEPELLAGALSRRPPVR
jgi:HAD superfamily hydrolase (TIGR01509 family)